MSYGPPTDPEVRARYRAELDAAYDKIDAATRSCRYCKAAKTRARNKALGERNGGDFLVALLEKADKAECGYHRRQRSLVYVTSPASETYWSS